MIRYSLSAFILICSNCSSNGSFNIIRTFIAIFNDVCHKRHSQLTSTINVLNFSLPKFSGVIRTNYISKYIWCGYTYILIQKLPLAILYNRVQIALLLRESWHVSNGSNIGRVWKIQTILSRSSNRFGNQYSSTGHPFLGFWLWLIIFESGDNSNTTTRNMKLDRHSNLTFITRLESH